MANKKASDVINDLNEKIDYLVRMNNLNANNYKIIIQQLNDIKRSLKGHPVQKQGEDLEKIQPEIPAVLPSPPISPPIEKPVQPSAPKVEVLSGAEALAMKMKHAQQQNKASPLDEMLAHAEQEVAEPQMSGRRRGQRSTDNSIIVTQTVIDANGKPIALATVKLTDASGNSKTMRTNTKGIWMSSVNEGKYKLEILKSFLTDPKRKPVEAQQVIEIPGTESKYTLPDLQTKESL